MLCLPAPAPSGPPWGQSVLPPSLGAQHVLATVVEVAAEAGVSPDARCAESSAEVRAVHLRAHTTVSRWAGNGRGQDPLGLEM